MILGEFILNVRMKRSLSSDGQRRGGKEQGLERQRKCIELETPSIRLEEKRRGSAILVPLALDRRDHWIDRVVQVSLVAPP